MIGGSSALNFLAYVRPSREDIDSWASQAPGWSWSTLEPYFHKSESLQLDSTPNRPEYFKQNLKNHGQSGPIQVSWAPSGFGIDEKVVDGITDATIPIASGDVYGGHRQGFAQSLMTVDRRDKKVVRSYAAGYLEPYLDRPNLHILTEATVEKILLDADNRQAKSVLFTYDGAQYEVSTKCEVILSASTIQSPRILELSGIGNPNILQSVGIPCVVSLPEVGENLQEHFMSNMVYELVKSPENTTLDSLFSEPGVFSEHSQRLQETQDGMLSNQAGMNTYIPYGGLVSKERLTSTIAKIEFEELNATSPYHKEQLTRQKHLLQDPNAPAIAMVGMGCNFDIAAGYGHQGHVVHGRADGSSNDCYSIIVSSMYPSARGSTHIVPSECGDGIQDSPEIDLDFLAHSVDEGVIAAGLEAVDRAFRSEHLAGRVSKRLVPAPEVDIEDGAQAREHMRVNSMIFNHNLGTCAMGRVVDERLRVKGISNLRVVDCSVIPDQISANTVATVYAVAERAADLIIEDLQRSC